MSKKTSEINEGDGAPLETVRAPRLKVGPGTNYPLQVRSGAVEKSSTEAGGPRSLVPEVALPTERATTVLGFTNSSGRDISIAYGVFDQACGDDCGDPWELAGWVNLAHGQSQTRSNPTGNQWCYFFAFDGAGAQWAGHFPARILKKAFNRCWCVASTSPLEWEVGMDEVDLAVFPGGVDFTA